MFRAGKIFYRKMKDYRLGGKPNVLLYGFLGQTLYTYKLSKSVLRTSNFGS